MIFNAGSSLLIVSAMLAFSGCSGGGGSSSPAPVVSVPGAPVTVTAVAGVQSISLTWSAVSNATSYKVYRSSTGVMGSTAYVSTSQTSTVDQNISTTYYYAVSAVNSAGESARSNIVSATPVVSAPTGTITISGTVQYQDKEYGFTGFTGNQPYKAVRYAPVELIPVGSSTPASVASAVTDSTGFYSMSTVTTGAVYVRVKAQASPSGNTSPDVLVANLAGQEYAQASADFVASGDATVNISVPASSIGGAFNILDVFTNTLKYVDSVSGTYPTGLVGYWQSGNTTYGTYYCQTPQWGCPDGEGIYVYSDPTDDTDEYDDDVLYHESGHFIAAHFSRDDSPGGVHMLSSNDLDLRLAWSEGWGDSMPGQVKRWLNATSQENLLSSTAAVPPSEYVDTYGSTAMAIDMGNPGGAPFNYACNEVAVAKILLDLNSQVNRQSVWDVISSFPTGTATVNLELFWDQWNSLEPAGTIPTISNVFNARSVTYSDLATNTTFTTAVPIAPNTPVTYNLYPAGDADYFALNATPGRTYTVTTSSLRNGADTVVSVYDPTQTLITNGTNDNANGTVYSGTVVPSDVWTNLCDSYGVCHDNGSPTLLGYDVLGSKVSFTASSSGGTYYIKVQSSSGRPVSAGRYGTYTLTVQ